MAKGGWRAPKKEADFARKPARRAPRRRILIACEGESTEPHYLNDLKAALGLTSAEVVVVGKGCSSNPSAVVTFTIRQMKEDPSWDAAYCVFDKDGRDREGRDTYREAIETAAKARLSGQRTVVAIPSVPCFEYWLLLHFVYTTSPFGSAKEAAARLAGYLPGYAKGARDVFRHVGNDLAKAEAHAAKACDEVDGDNPSTRVHDLVSAMRAIAES